MLRRQIQGEQFSIIQLVWGMKKLIGIIVTGTLVWMEGGKLDAKVLNLNIFYDVQRIFFALVSNFRLNRTRFLHSFGPVCTVIPYLHQSKTQKENML